MRWAVSELGLGFTASTKKILVSDPLSSGKSVLDKIYDILAAIIIRRVPLDPVMVPKLVIGSWGDGVRRVFDLVEIGDGFCRSEVDDSLQKPLVLPT
jgi:hypothetical protein